MTKFRKQTFGCTCRLITAINARIFLGGEDVSEDEFNILVDLTKCRNGGALSINKAHEHLGLTTNEGPVETLDIEWVRHHLPVEIEYYDPNFGFHSALVIKVDCDEVSLINSSWAKIKWADIDFYNHLYNRTLRTFHLREYNLGYKPGTATVK